MVDGMENGLTPEEIQAIRRWREEEPDLSPVDIAKKLQISSFLVLRVFVALAQEELLDDREEFVADLKQRVDLGANFDSLNAHYGWMKDTEE